MSGTRIAHAIFCGILFACAAALLGLTAYHVNFTETLFGAGFYVPIVVELLVTSCLAVIVSLWFLIAIILRKGGKTGYCVEAVLLFIICIMFLVGASIFSRGWHTISWCASSRYVCRILSAIIAFSWINWVLTMILLIICIMDMTNEDSDTDPRPIQTAQTATATTPLTNTAQV